MNVIEVWVFCKNSDVTLPSNGQSKPFCYFDIRKERNLDVSDLTDARDSLSDGSMITGDEGIDALVLSLSESLQKNKLHFYGVTMLRCYQQNIEEKQF